jgi:glucuronate isomerase
MNDNFLLQGETARRLYHDFAASEPILDFHSHLPAADIADDCRFRDLTQIWLEGDHYKWRLMRASGTPERYCTGEATSFEKFQAWASTVPSTLRSPLYQWTHLELKRYFQIDDLLNERTAKAVWKKANSLLQASELSEEEFSKDSRCRLRVPPTIPATISRSIAA